jgi:hypothetical protein
MKSFKKRAARDFPGGLRKEDGTTGDHHWE